MAYAHHCYDEDEEQERCFGFFFFNGYNKKNYEKMSKIEGQDEALCSVKADSETAPSL